MNFNAVNSVRCENKVLTLKTRYKVSNVTDYKYNLIDISYWKVLMHIKFSDHKAFH